MESYVFMFFEKKEVTCEYEPVGVFPQVTLFISSQSD